MLSNPDLASANQQDVVLTWPGRFMLKIENCHVTSEESDRR